MGLILLALSPHSVWGSEHLAIGQSSPEQGLWLSSRTAVSSSFRRMCFRNTWHVIFHLCGRARWEIRDGKWTLRNRTYFKFSCSSQIRSVFDFILFCLEWNRDCKEGTAARNKDRGKSINSRLPDPNIKYKDKGCVWDRERDRESEQACMSVYSKVCV